MLVCLSFVIMRCTATFAILCLAVLLEHAQTCFEGPLPKKKNGFIPRLPRSFCWNHLLAALCLRNRKKHTAPWIAEHRVVPMFSTTTLCNVASARLFGICNDAVLCGVAVEYWRGIVDVDGFVLCSVEIATPLCNGKKLGGFLECSWPCFARLLHFGLQGTSFFFCLFCSRLHGIPEATWLAACYLKTI